MAIYTNEHLADLLNEQYEKVRKLEQELQRLKSNFAGYENFQMEKQLKQELELIKLERDEFKKYSTMWFDKKNELEQELQKTREQLVESNELLIDVRYIFQDKIFLLNINDSCFSRLRRWNNGSQKYIDKYFKDKDKQGE